MADAQPQDPLRIPIGGKKMSIDLNAILTQESIQAHQHTMNESKSNVQSSNNLVRHVAVKKFDEVQAIESKAVRGVFDSDPKSTG